MQSELHTLVLSSMTAYLELLRSFATPDSERQVRSLENVAANPDPSPSPSPTPEP